MYGDIQVEARSTELLVLNKLFVAETKSESFHRNFQAQPGSRGHHGEGRHSVEAYTRNKDTEQMDLMEE